MEILIADPGVLAWLPFNSPYSSSPFITPFFVGHWESVEPDSSFFAHIVGAAYHTTVIHHSSLR